MRAFPLLLTVLALLYACTRKTGDISVSERSLQMSSRMQVELVKPNDFILDGNYLIIHDAGAHMGYVKVVDIRNDSLVNEFFPHGQGPDDALAITSMSVSDGHLYILDNLKQRITAFALDSIESFGKKTYEYEQSWPASGAVLSFTAAADRYIVHMWKEEDKFLLLDKALQEKGRGGTFLPAPSSSESYDVNVRSMADAGKTYLSPDKRHLVDIVFKACAISFYAIAGDTLRQEWSHLLEPYKYKTDGFNIEAQGNLGYKSVAMTDSLIYALYCGKPMDNDSWATSASVIHVYDFTGSQLEKINLEEPAVRICISPDGKTLYALNFDVEPSVCVYQLDRYR